METHEILSKDGLKLFCCSYRAKKSVASIVLVHGFAEHCGRYTHVIKELRAAGFNVLCVDLRGHGLSQGRRGYIEHFSHYIDDLSTAVQYAQELFSCKQVLLLGHSMGALVATFYAASFQHNLRGMVLSSPFFGITLPVPLHKKVAGNVMSKFMPGFTLPSTITGKYLSHDPEVAKQYDADPLVFHTITARWFTEIVRSHEMVTELAPKLLLPVFVQFAGDDHIVKNSVAFDWFDNCASADKKKSIYEGFLHEIYNEEGKEGPITDMIQWFTEHSG